MGHRQATNFRYLLPAILMSVTSPNLKYNNSAINLHKSDQSGPSHLLQKWASGSTWCWKLKAWGWTHHPLSCADWSRTIDTITQYLLDVFMTRRVRLYYFQVHSWCHCNLYIIISQLSVILIQKIQSQCHLFILYRPYSFIQIIFSFIFPFVHGHGLERIPLTESWPSRNILISLNSLTAVFALQYGAP